MTVRRHLTATLALLALVGAAVQMANAQPVTLGVTEIRPMPTDRSDGAVARFGDSILYAGGYGEGYLDSIISYSMTGDARVIGKLPLHLSSMSSAVVGSRMYVFGGSTPNGDPSDWRGHNVASIIEIDPTNGVAQTLTAKLPSARTAAAAAATSSGVYIFGGETREYRGAVTDDILRFDATTKTVTKVGSLPGARGWLAAAAANDLVYLFGGWSNAGGLSNQIIKFDPKSSTSEILATTLPLPMEGASAVWDGAVIWVVGGRTAAGESSHAFLFDPATGAILPGALAMPHAAEKTRTVLLEGCVYVLGGEWESSPGRQSYLDSVLRVDASCGHASIDIAQDGALQEAIQRKARPAAALLETAVHATGAVRETVVNEVVPANGASTTGGEQHKVIVRPDAGRAAEIRASIRTGTGTVEGLTGSQAMPFIQVQGDVLAGKGDAVISWTLPDRNKEWTMVEWDGDSWTPVASLTGRGSDRAEAALPGPGLFALIPAGAAFEKSTPGPLLLLLAPALLAVASARRKMD